jgi:hypothetical protein
MEALRFTMRVSGRRGVPQLEIEPGSFGPHGIQRGYGLAVVPGAGSVLHP